MNKEPDVLRKKEIYSGDKIRLVVDETSTSAGELITREIIEHPRSVVIVPLDENGNVLLVRQYRYGAGRVLLEAPAGCLEDGEDPVHAAQRELREETGFSATDLELLGDFWTAPGLMTEHMYVYCATGLSWNPLPADKDEDIQVQKFEFREAVAMAGTGRILDSKSIAALFLTSKISVNSKS